VDNDIAQAAAAYRQRAFAGPRSADPAGAAIGAPCRGRDDGFCSRFGLFIVEELCAACRSADAETRAAALQRLMGAAMTAELDPKPCELRSPPIGAREDCPCPGKRRTTSVYVCGRDGRKVSLANCALCQEKDGLARRVQERAFRVLNAKLVPAVPTSPTAEPEVRVFRLQGKLSQRGGGTFHGLLFSRRKPQFRLARATPVRRIVLNVTHACNLACGYCFAGGNRPGRTMSLDVARKGIRLLDPRGAVDVAFFGGEPLLAWNLVTEAMREARDLAAKRKVRAKFHITSNGLLLDERKVRFLSDQPCSMLISLDGPEDIHNAARPARDAKRNSFRETMAALERARGAPLGRRIMARATFDAAQPQLVRRLEFLAGLHDAGFVRGFSIEPAVLGEGCAKRSGSFDRNVVANEYHAAAEWYVARARAGRSAEFFHFRKLIERILYAKHAGTECGAGNGYVTLAPDGTLYACHREAGTKVGHVDYGFDEQLRSAWADNRVYARNGCMTCWARYLCGGGCRQACLELAKDLRAAVPERCFLQRTMLKECLWILTQLTREQIARVVKP